MIANLFTKVNNLAREVGLAIKALKTETNTKFDNLAVGGRNLLLATRNPRVIGTGDTNNYAYNRYTLSIPTVPGTTYTFTAKVRAIKGTITKVSCLSFTSEQMREPERNIITVPVVNGKIKGSFTATVANSGNILFYAGEHSKTAGNIMEISEVKFETGTIPTDWTPAPEDITPPALNRANILPNGGFENGLVGWTSSLEFVVDDHPSFGRCLFVNNPGSVTGNHSLASKRIKCEAGRTYTISCDSALTATAGELYCDLLFFNDKDVQLLDGPNVSAIGTHDYDTVGNRHEVAVVAPAGAVTMMARFVVQGVTGATYIGVRQIKVETGGLPSTPYTPNVEYSDSYSVGGNNLLLNTETFNKPWRIASDDGKTTWVFANNTAVVDGVTANKWKHVGYDINKAASELLLSEGNRFTLSVYARKVSGDGDALNIALRKGVTGGFQDNHVGGDFKLTSEWQRCVVTGTISKTDLQYLFVRFEWRNAAKYEFKLPKLEFGSTATAWSPHYKDTIGYITIDSGNIDVNTFTTPGKYFIATGGTRTNSPVSSWFYLTVDALNADRIIQYVRSDTDLDAQYSRVKFGDTWKAWERVNTGNAANLTSGNLPNARLNGTYNGITVELNGTNILYSSQSPGSPAKSFTAYGISEYKGTGSVGGFIVFKTPIPKGQVCSLKFDLRGTLGSPLSDVVDMTVYVTPTATSPTGGIYKCHCNSGVALDIKAAFVDNFLSFIVHKTGEALVNPHLAITQMQFSDNTNTAYLKAWSVSVATSISATNYTNVTNIPLIAPVFSNGIQFDSDGFPYYIKIVNGTVSSGSEIEHGITNSYDRIRSISINIRERIEHSSFLVCTPEYKITGNKIIVDPSNKYDFGEWDGKYGTFTIIYS